MTKCNFCSVLQGFLSSNRRVNAFDEFSTNQNINKIFLPGKILGNGRFSTVRQVLDREDGLTYAIKKIEKKKLTYKEVMLLKNEINIQTSLDHPHIVKLYAAINDDHYYYLFTEMSTGGELLDEFSSKTSYSMKEAKTVIRTLLDAIEYCHSKKITHRDIKPGNIFLSNKLNYCNVKLGDFGFATYTPSPHSLQTQCGTAAFAAPEIIIGNSYGTKVDMWSLGVVFYMLLLGDHPFYNSDQSIMIQNITSGKCQHSLEYWNNSFLSKETRNFLSSLLQIHPQKRLSAKQALDHPFIFHDCNRNSCNKDDCNEESNASKKADDDLRITRQKLKAAVLAIKFANKISTSIPPKEFDAKKMFKATLYVIKASGYLEHQIKS